MSSPARGGVHSICFEDASSRGQRSEVGRTQSFARSHTDRSELRILYCLRSFSTTAAKKSRSSMACFPTGFGRAPSPTTTTLFFGLM